ncbi:MAG: AIM24 family protein [Acidimicrobiales bacterium]
MSPVEGWYPDPAGNPTLERYWDGAAWTSNTRALGGEAPPPPPAPQAPSPQAASPPPPGAGPGFDSSAQPAAASAAPAPAPGAAPAVMSASSSIGGISTELLTDERFAEVESNERVVRQNSRLLKVRLGEDLLAKQGSMVAFQGQIDFDHEGSGATKFLKKAMTGEGLPLMRCSGQGELFLADSGFQVHIIHLDGAGLTVNGRNVLAFEPSLSWDIERVKGGAMMAGGLFNTRLEGHGWVAITTDGDPVVLRTNQQTFADTDAAVAWSSSLSTTLNKTVKAQAFIGRGSGEAVQLAFQGDGIVIVQPSEGSSVPPHSH